MRVEELAGRAGGDLVTGSHDKSRQQLLYNVSGFIFDPTSRTMIGLQAAFSKILKVMMCYNYK